MYYDSFFWHKTLKEGKTYLWNGREFLFKNGIPREISTYQQSQAQVKDAFSFKWSQRDSYKSEAYVNKNYGYLLNLYFGGDEGSKRVFFQKHIGAQFLDAGCGAGFSASTLFGQLLNDVHYLGIDISDSVDIAKETFEAKGIKGEFIQADITNLPVQEPKFDVIFSEGVLHHTAPTKESLRKMVGLLKPGGVILFYVYKKKGPAREYLDDYIRDKISGLSDREAWEALKPLTALGISLGELNAHLEIKDDIDVLGIPKGTYDVQRLFYWHVAKTYYDPKWTFDEMNHVTFDWYRPKYAHRQTPEEVLRWCADFSLTILRLYVDEAGITVIAEKRCAESMGG